MRAMRSQFVTLLTAALFAAPAAAQTRLTAVQDLRLSGEREDFSKVTKLAVSKKGTIAILLAQDLEFRLYGADGKSLGRYGRKGEGPGEFRSPFGTVGWRGDTLWFNESGRGVLTLIGPDTKLVRSFRPMQQLLPPTPVHDSGRISITPQALREDGTILSAAVITGPLWLSWIPGGISGLMFVHADANGRLLHYAGMVKMDALECSVGTDRGSMSIPFCPRATFGVAPNGESVAIVEPLKGGKPGYDLTVIRVGKGDTLLGRRFPGRLQPVPVSVRDSVISALQKRGVMPDLVKQIVIPKNFPPVKGIVVGSDSVVWLENGAGDLGSGSTWRLITFKGSVLGDVTFPRGFQLISANRTQAWGVLTDTDGVEDVVRYRIRP